MEGSRTAILELSVTLLLQLLKLPDDTEIIGIAEGSFSDAGLNTILLRVTNDDLDFVEYGHGLPRINPSYEVRNAGPVIAQRDPILVSWGKQP
jgi:hypothetical protein